jgi:hypothetical protein
VIAKKDTSLMPFGLSNVAATFDHPKKPHEPCLLYLDDVIVFGCTFKEHLLKLREAFRQILEA